MTDQQDRQDRTELPASSILGRRITRRNLLVLGTGAAGVLVLAACGGADPTPTQLAAQPTTAPAAGGAAAPTTGPLIGAAPPTTAAQPTTAPAAQPTAAQQRGGVLKIAIIGEPPVVADAMSTTATVTSNVAQQIFEGLFARDARFAPKPMLVDRYTASPDGKSYEFTLRRGVKFHNGKEMTSADVVASLKRWGALTGRGKLIFGRLEENGLQARDPLTVTMAFKQPTGVLLDFLALIEAFILPAEIAEAAGTNRLSEQQFIGTGPFMFKERQADRFIRLVRFDGYSPRDDAASGAAGRKVAYLDELQIIPVPDASVRTNGVVTGEYHFSETVDADQYDTVRNDPNINALIVKPYYWYCPHFNKKQGLFTDVRMRQAVAALIPAGEAMIAGFGRQDFIRLDPSVSAPETVWHSTAGQDRYNKADVERARGLLRDAGYNGQTIRWLATKEYSYNFPIADLTKQKMEAAGMKVELVVSDWATLVQNRAKPEVYEIFLTGHSGYSHPATQPFNDKAWPGFWDSPEKDRLVGAMVAEADPAKQKALIDEYERLIYQEVPFVKLGDNFLLRAARKEVKGYVNPADWFFWNVSLG